MFIASAPLGGYGINGQRAIEMAMEEINGSGGVLGRKLVATFADPKLKPEVAVELAEKFITEDKVDFLMGPTSSGVASTLSDVARKHKKILVNTKAAIDTLIGAYASGPGSSPSAFTPYGDTWLRTWRTLTKFQRRPCRGFYGTKILQLRRDIFTTSTTIWQAS